MPASLDDAARMRLLYEVTALHKGTLEARLEEALELVTRALSLDIGIISEVEGGTYTVKHVYAPGANLRAGQRFLLEQTYCQLVLDADKVVSINHATCSPHANHPCCSAYGLESFIGAVVTVGSRRVGTLNFISEVPRDVPFSEADEALVEMLARWTGIALTTQQAEIARAESERRFHSAFENAPIGMAIVAPSGRLLEVNPSLCGMLGYTPDELLALGFQQLTHPEDLETDMQHLGEVLAGTRTGYQIEKRYLHRSGKVLWGNLSVSAVHFESGDVKYLIGQVENITARKESEAQVLEMAYHDDLTGLYNRRYFLERVPEQLTLAQQTGASAVLLYLDLNDFKQVNDTLGHRAGDDLLRGVARRFEKALRQEDILARLGGDEFSAFLASADDEKAKRVAERLAASLEEPFLLLGTTWQLGGVSVGVIHAEGETELETLLKRADTAMYRAKYRKREEPRAVEHVPKKNESGAALN